MRARRHPGMEVRDLFFGLLLATLFVLAALIVKPFVSYVLAAVLLAFVLRPAHLRLAPAVGERPSGALLVVLAVLVTIVPATAISAVVVSDAAEASDDIRQRPVLNAIERALNSAGLEVSLPSEVQAAPQQLLRVFVGEAPDLIGATVQFLIGLSLVAFLLYYMLVDGERFVAWVREITPLPAEMQDRLYAEANAITWAVLKGHLFTGVAQGILGGLGLLVAGVPNALFWTVVMILASFVPIVGVTVVWAPAGLYLLLTGDVAGGAFLLVYGATVVSWVDNYLRAFVVDRGSDLHPGVIIVGVLGGIYFMGALGLFIGPIVLAIFKATLTVFDDYYGA